ncbi:MAG: ABC transporter ATP-binding protein [Chloroflexi bacterium]|nr:ABC transporter ATP-binding protein [Chloroflexota bacterium]
MEEVVLRVDDLTMHYATRQGWVRAVEGVSFSLGRGEALGLVGESGCGKTSVAVCLLRALPDNGRILKGSILLDGTDLVSLTEEEMRQHRWRRISMVFQAAMSSLNPVQRVGAQVVEVIHVHESVGLDAARERVVQLFSLVGLDRQLMERYPHELSGGMKQRAVIAMALACRPDVIIADEPTTALDVIVQHRVLQELKQVQQSQGTAIIYISHDIGVVAEVCTRIAVMYAGRIAEVAPTAELLTHPVHPYTQALLSSFPRLRGPKHSLASLPGDPPSLVAPPSGCRFHPRCPYATSLCQEKDPALQEHRPRHLAACWHPLLGGDEQ